MRCGLGRALCAGGGRGGRRGNVFVVRVWVCDTQPAQRLGEREIAAHCARRVLRAEIAAAVGAVMVAAGAEVVVVGKIASVFSKRVTCQSGFLIPSEPSCCSINN